MFEEPEKEPFFSGARKTQIIVALIAAVAVIYYFSNPKPSAHYDYTFRVAENILRGRIGFAEKPPTWLNEFVPFGNKWFSVFPLGGVLTMIPFAFLKLVGIVKEMPAAFIASFSSAVICIFLYLISNKYAVSFAKQILLIVSILFGTWMWMNLTFGGAWQFALGFAMIGELGAIYFTVYDRKPLVAGFFFAMAFGNRTENLLTAPIFMWILYKFQVSSFKFQVEEIETENKSSSKKRKIKDQNFETKSEIPNPKSQIIHIARFCVFPFILGILTLVYNYIRFDSPTDFGYARIPGVLQEPWYFDGIFSVQYIPGQAWEMLLHLWEVKNEFPYLVPNGFSSSIVWSSPFLLLIFRRKHLNRSLVILTWIAIVILTFLLWIHGNSGGWQFGYRYAMILLPWFFVLLLENSPKKITLTEGVLIAFSILMNLYATWLFHWTDYVKP
ncbi:MAG TPA: hypothetical protein PKY59_27595 [Pyrinomonadaceae bacterium]|nr:hypothetical protein [Pyrinomonadaceae bacterium]